MDKFGVKNLQIEFKMSSEVPNYNKIRFSINAQPTIVIVNVYF